MKCYLVFGTTLKPPREVARRVMDHHRRIRRLVVEARVAALGPCEKGPIHFHPQFSDPRACLRPRRRGRLQPENLQLRPTVGERRPFVVPRFGSGNRGVDRLHQAPEAARPVGLGVDSDPHRRPFAAKGIARFVRHGGQHPFGEQVVDIDANVVVIEGKVHGPVELEAERSAHIPRAVADVPREAVEKERPAFLQEREEGMLIRHDGLKRPGVECPATLEQVNQAVIQDAWQSLAPVVSPQQDAQQVRRLPDERGRDLEDVEQREILRRVVSEPVRPFLFPCAVEGGEIALVERGDHRTTEARKQLAETEGELSAGAQHVVRKGRHLVVLGADHDHEIGGLAPNPAGPEPRFVGEAESHAVLEQEYFESPFADGFEKRLLEQQSVRVGHQGELGDVRRELLQYPVAPVVRVRAWSAHAAPVASVRVSAWSNQSRSFWSS